MVKRKQERIYSGLLKELKEMESGFTPEKEELKDPAKMAATILTGYISEENSDKQPVPAQREEILVTSPQNGSLYVLYPGLQSLPSPETSPSSRRYVSKRIILLLFAVLIGLAALKTGKPFQDTARVRVNEDLRQAVSRGDLPEVKRLIAKGAEVNAKGKYGSTPLMHASMNGDREVVQELLSKGAEVNAKDNNGQTALMAASDKGQQEVKELLIKAGAK